MHSCEVVAVSGRRTNDDGDACARTTLVFTTIERTKQALDLIVSARSHLPDLSILVAEQTNHDTGLEARCADLGARYMRLAYDVGLPAARNALVRAIDTEYFILADDDFVIDRPLELSFCVRFMDAHPDMLCLGGDLEDYVERNAVMVRSVRMRASNIGVDTLGRGYIQVPVALSGSKELIFESETVLICDYVPNWGVFRRCCFTEGGTWWDERNAKIRGQHLDFFLNVKFNTPYHVAWWSGFVCLHAHRSNDSYAPLRGRKEWEGYFARKWNCRYLHELGKAFRFVDDFYTVVDVPSLANERLRKTTELNERLRERLAKAQKSNESFRGVIHEWKERVAAYKKLIEELKVKNADLRRRLALARPPAREVGDG